jgi:hypothetical protein
MRNWKTFLMTLLVGSVSYANAQYYNQYNNGPEMYQQQPEFGACCDVEHNDGSYNKGTTQVDFEVGYRRDSLSFGVDVPACHPFFSKRSKFEDLDIFQIGLQGRTTIGSNFYLRGGISGGWILDGDFKEKNDILFSAGNLGYAFEEVNDLAVNFESKDSIDGRFVIDLDAAIGYPFFFCDCGITLAPVIGYAFNEQSVRIENHKGLEFEEVSNFLVPQENGCCGSHHFVSRWYGPFVGLDFVYRPHNQCWGLWAELEYHWAHQKTKKNGLAFNHDNGDHFDSTSHRAHGWVFNVGADYEFDCDWTAGLSVKVQDWSSSRHHRDCGFERSGCGCNDGEARTNVQWHSFAVNVTVGRAF